MGRHKILTQDEILLIKQALLEDRCSKRELAFKYCISLTTLNKYLNEA